MQAPGSPRQPLVVQHRVHLAGARRLDALPFGPGTPERGCRVAAAEEARPMAGGEGRRLVEEKQFGPALRRHHVAAAAAKVAGADDPRLGGPAPPQQCLARGIMDDATVAGEQALVGRRNDVAERGDAILQRHESDPSPMETGFWIRSCPSPKNGSRIGARRALRRPVADRRLERQAGVPGEEDPGVLRHLGDVAVDQRAAHRLGVDGREMRRRHQIAHHAGGLAGVDEIVDDQDALAGAAADLENVRRHCFQDLDRALVLVIVAGDADRIDHTHAEFAGNHGGGDQAAAGDRHDGLERAGVVQPPGQRAGIAMELIP